MSIVFGVLTHDNNLLLAADRRGIRNGIVDDNYQKIFKLRENLFFGMTGIAEYGLTIKEQLSEVLEKPLNEILEFANSIYPINNLSSTIMLCGKKPNNIAFIWSKNTRGEISYVETSFGNVQITINAARNLDLINSKFEDELLKSMLNYELAIKNTIEYASIHDSSISSHFEMIKI